jgi:hypothetical protein
MEGHTHFGSATVVPNNCGNDGSETVSCVICDSNIVTVLEATNDHNYIDGVCDVCGKSLCPSGAEHSMKRVVIYENGFMATGRITEKCQNDGCTYEVKESDIDAIFTFKGYSAKINGNKITVSYLVNNTALKTYEEVNTVALRFGAVASVAQGTENSPISVSEGALSAENNVVMAQVNNAFSGFDFILNGFSAAHYEKAIIMCAYVFDGSKLSYLCINDNNIVGQYDYAYAMTFSKHATEE